MTDYSTWAVQLENDKVRLDDLSVGFWDGIAKRLTEVERDENGRPKSDSETIALLLITPLNRPEIALAIAVEAATLLKKPDPEAYVNKLIESDYGTPSLRRLGDLFVPAGDDLPTELSGEPGSMVPPQGADGSTDT